jgi:Flp pilus assembly pilin Flp
VAKQSSAFDRSRTRKQLAARVRDERAQTMSEYAVILTAITVAVVLAVGLLSTSIGSHITDIANLIR